MEKIEETNKKSALSEWKDFAHAQDGRSPSPWRPHEESESRGFCDARVQVQEGIELEEEFFEREKRLHRKLKKISNRRAERAEIKNASRNSKVNWIISETEERDEEIISKKYTVPKWRLLKTQHSVLKFIYDRFSGPRNCMKRAQKNEYGALSNISVTGDSNGCLKYTGLTVCKCTDCIVCGDTQRSKMTAKLSKMMHAVHAEGGFSRLVTCTKSPEISDYLTIKQVHEANKAVRMVVKNFNKRKGTHIGYSGVGESAFSRKYMRYHHTGRYIGRKKYIHGHLHAVVSFGLADVDYEDEIRILIRKTWVNTIRKHGGHTFIDSIPEYMLNYGKKYLEDITFRWDEIKGKKGIAKYLTDLKKNALDKVSLELLGGNHKGDAGNIKGRGLHVLLEEIATRTVRDPDCCSFEQEEDIRLYLSYMDAMYKKRRILNHNLDYWCNKFDWLRAEQMSIFAKNYCARFDTPFTDVSKFTDYLIPPEEIEGVPGAKEYREVWFPEDSLTAVFAKDVPEPDIVWRDTVNGYVWNEFSFQRRAGVISLLLSRYHYDNFNEIAYMQFKSICDVGDKKPPDFKYEIRGMVELWLQMWGSEYDVLPVSSKEIGPPKPKNIVQRTKWFFFQ